MNPDVVITNWDTEELPQVDVFDPKETTVFKPVVVNNVAT